MSLNSRIIQASGVLMCPRKSGVVRLARLAVPEDLGLLAPLCGFEGPRLQARQLKQMFGMKSRREDRPRPDFERVRSDVLFGREPSGRDHNSFRRGPAIGALPRDLRHSDEKGLRRYTLTAQPDCVGNLVVMLNEPVQVIYAALEL